MNLPESLSVTLLVGGASPERSVSKSSSKAIYAALLSLGARVRLIDPAYGKLQPDTIEEYFIPSDCSTVSHTNYFDAVQLIDDQTDVVFIGLHGKWGEDGTIQSLLELRGLKFTGSGVLSSALAMDKFRTKLVLKRFGVRTPEDLFVKAGFNDFVGLDKQIIEKLKYPVIVKPNDQGSTVGLSVVKGSAELEKAIGKAGSFSEGVLIEEFIDGSELTVGIIDGKALTPLEIRPDHGLYDYECKYTSGMSQYLVPAPFPEDILNTMKKETELAYTGLNCSGYGRADFRVSPEGEVYCLEMNTLPGMTATSLLPKMAKCEGISFEELVGRIVSLALRD